MLAAGPQESPSSGTAKPSGAAQGQKLWAVLLVLDAFCVIVFGGALAAKVYQHWQAPTPVLVPQRRPRPAPPKPAEKADKPEAKPAPAPPAQAEKKASAPPARALPAANGMKPPKPSLLREAPRHESAQLASADKQPAKAEKAAKAEKPPKAEPAASEGKAKAVPVDFRIKAPKADKVELAGPFIVRGGRKPMIDKGDGSWTITLYLTPNTYRYHFLVDGKKKLDPDNPKTDRGASVVTVP